MGASVSDALRLPLALHRGKSLANPHSVPKAASMLSCREALDLILAIPFALRTERVPLLQAGGRFLAEPVAAPWQLPRFANSAMDGFAFRAADAPADLRIVGESAAGHAFGRTVGPGEAIRISTGAPMAGGADAVLPVEKAVVRGDVLAVGEAVAAGRFVRRAGEDVAAGTRLFAAGTRLTAPRLAFLAMYNLPDVAVAVPPKVAILTSGDEVKPHGAPLRESDIVGSNIYYLQEELRATGCEPRLFGISPDDAAAFTRMMREALAWADMVVTTAGVSVGEHDVVGAAMEALGARVLFWKVAVRPGKPMLVATIDGKPVFGLPGNPASVVCNTEIFLKPFLRKAFGASPVCAATESMPTVTDLARDPQRQWYLFAEIGLPNGSPWALAMPNQSSGNLFNAARANGLIVLPPGTMPVRAGEKVDVIRLREPE